MVTASTESLSSIFAASARRMASMVTAFRASLSFRSSGLALPTSIYASSISVADFRTRSFVSSMEVLIFSACCVSHWIFSSSRPVSALRFAAASSFSYACLRSWLSFIATPVRAAIAPVICKLYSLNHLTPLLNKDSCWTSTARNPARCSRRTASSSLYLFVASKYSLEPTVIPRISSRSFLASASTCFMLAFTSLPSMYSSMPLLRVLFSDAII